MELTLSELLSHFAVTLDDDNELPYGNGHINETFVVGHHPRYILQKINTNVFRDPDAVMQNIVAVTEHVRRRAAADGADPCRATLTLLPTVDGKNYYRAPDGGCYRLYLFIEGCVCYDRVEDPRQLYHAARAFGRFQKYLDDFPADTLHEVIPHFHDTRDRFRQLREAIAADRVGRADGVRAEIDFALAREGECGRVLDAIAAGEIPLRVTHNDTKLNNVMLDEKTGEGVCVIDLDTVMPGSLLYDFGDALRFGASSGAEDEKDLDRIFFRLDCYEEFTRGFLAELGGRLTEKEAELLPFSARLMTYECGIRFLTDYLNGDTYFRIHRPEHNLDRCRTQFKLVADMEQKDNDMKAITARYL